MKENSSVERVLVSGGTGFLGLSVTKALLKKGHEVFVTVRDTTAKERIAQLPEAVHCVNIAQDLEKVLPSLSVIVNTVGCYGKDGEAINTIADANLLFPMHLLQRVPNQVLCINTSTSLPAFVDIYSFFKRCFSDYLQSALVLCTRVDLKIDMIYGPDNKEPKFLPRIIQTILRNKAVQLTDGTQVRGFIHVHDVASAICLLIEKRMVLHDYHAFELGTGEGVMIRDVIQFVADIIRREYHITPELLFGAIPKRPNEPESLVMEAHALKKLGWVPQYHWPNGVEEAVLSYLENQEKKVKV